MKINICIYLIQIDINFFKYSVCCIGLQGKYFSIYYRQLRQGPVISANPKSIVSFPNLKWRTFFTINGNSSRHCREQPANQSVLKPEPKTLYVTELEIQMQVIRAGIRISPYPHSVQFYATMSRYQIPSGGAISSNLRANLICGIITRWWSNTTKRVFVITG